MLASAADRSLMFARSATAGVTDTSQTPTTLSAGDVRRLVLDRVESGIRFGPVGSTVSRGGPEDFSEEPAFTPDAGAANSAPI